MEAQDAYVVDVVTARDDVPPRAHTLEAWLEYKTGAWVSGPTAASRLTFGVPTSARPPLTLASAGGELAG